MFITLFLLSLVLVLSLYAATVASYTCKRFLDLERKFDELRNTSGTESVVEVVTRSPLYRERNAVTEEPL